MIIDEAILILMLWYASLVNHLSLVGLQFCLLLLLPPDAQVLVTVMEKQSPDFGEQQLHAVTQSCSEGVIAYDPALEGC